MARKMTEWPSKRGPITKIMPSDGCIGDTVPLAVGKWYEFHEFGWYMGNVGSLYNRVYHASAGEETGIHLGNAGLRSVSFQKHVVGRPEQAAYHSADL